MMLRRQRARKAKTPNPTAIIEYIFTAHSDAVLANQLTRAYIQLHPAYKAWDAERQHRLVTQIADPYKSFMRNAFTTPMAPHQPSGLV